MIELTITTYSNLSFTDELGLESVAPDASFRGDAVGANLTRIYRMTNSAWDRVRPRLRLLEQRRVPAIDAAGARIANRTMPAMEYSVTPVPGRTPRIHQVEETAPISIVSDGVLTVRGAALLNGTPAYLEILTQSGSALPGTTGTQRFSYAVKVLRITAVPVGPLGSLYGVRILPASGGGSVAVALGVDGAVQITVTPASGAATATEVAAQINGSAAAAYVTATALVGAALVPPTQIVLTGVPSAPQVTPQTHQFLYGGDGGGVAILDVPVTDGVATNRLRLTAQKGGNPSNRIALVLNMSQGSNSVSVSGKTITVNRTGSTETIANIVTAINANSSAAELVLASAEGSGSLAARTITYLYGGAGEEFSATVGGATAAITQHSDTSMVISVTAAALVAAGVAEREHTMVQILSGTLRLQAEVSPGAQPKSVAARVRAQGSVTIATPGATIDSVSMAVGDRFWTDVQSTSTQDGLYVWNGASAPATRAPEAPVGARVSGLLVSVSEGTTDGAKVFQVRQAPGADIIGTSGLTTVAI